MNDSAALRQRFDQYRARIWHQFLVSRSGWSDYRFDLTFGRDGEDGPRNATNRSRMFGPIRNGRAPSRGNRYNRKFDLVELVEQHELFKGSKAWFDSPFWGVATAIPQDVVQARDMVQRCFDRFGIVRFSHTFDLCWRIRALEKDVGTATLDTVIEGHPGTRTYLTGLAHALDPVTLPLDRMAIVGALFREAYLAGSLRIAAILEQVFLTELEGFLSIDWLQPILVVTREALHAEFQHDVINSVIRFFAHRCTFTDHYEELPADDVEFPLHRLTDAFVQEILENPDAARREVATHCDAYYRRAAASRNRESRSS